MLRAGPTDPSPSAARLTAAFLRACALDVAVRKPGNVSLASPGHGMQAAQFLASAAAAAGPLLQAGTPVGQRMDAAGAASWAVTGCNTNLGILLLCAPLAAAAQQVRGACTAPKLQHALQAVLAGLTVDDARAAYRAIHRANPGGLGRVDAQDVQSAPSINLRAAMALAAHRDSIARQYANGFTDLFQRAIALLDPGLLPLAADGQAPPGTTRQVQRVWLACLAAEPDAHIVRKHGEALAHTVMCAAQPWQQRIEAGVVVDSDPAFAAWDASLKQQGLNPGTSADFTVLALFAAGLLDSA